jgi:hypothetical protein
LIFLYVFANKFTFVIAFANPLLIKVSPII